MSRLLQQKVEELDGSRRLSGVHRAAVRIEDMDGLMRLAPLKSVKAAGANGAGVTVAEFNALVEDLHAVHRRLMALVERMRERRGR